MGKIKAKILMMDDQPEKVEDLRIALIQEGFDVLLVSSEEAARIAIETNRFDIAILDADLIDSERLRARFQSMTGEGGEALFVPEVGAGYRVCNWIRRSYPQVGVIVYTAARTEAVDRLEGFKHGADDYIINGEVCVEEALMRINSVLSRRTPQRVVGFELGGYYFDTQKNEVQRIDGKILSLTPAEVRVFSELAMNSWTALSRGAIYYAAFQEADVKNKNKSVDDLISKIRLKFRKTFSDEAPIKTVSGVGYRVDGGVLFDTRPIHTQRPSDPDGFVG